MFALDAFAGIGRAIPLITTSVVVVIGVAMAAARVFTSRNAAARSVIWQATLLASIVVPIAAVVGPPLRLQTSEASVPALRVAQQALAPTSNAPHHRTADPFAILGLLWFCGFVLTSGRLARQIMAAERLRRRSVAVVDHPALARGVRVLVSLDVDVPLALGVLRPAIIVPEASSEWSHDEWHLVLLHEHAHLARHDLIARAVGMFASLLHWYNPLVPLIRGRLERDAELAADAMVLSSGVLPSRYADVLLDMAERVLWHAAPEPSLTFARAGGLELRIGEILADIPNVAFVRRSTVVSVTMASAIVAAILGCLQLSVRPPAIVQSPPAAASGDWRVDARSALVALLRDPSPQVRAAAAHSLEQLGAKP